MTPGWVENLSDGPKIVHGPVFYINLEFETCGAGIWEKKINLGPSNVRSILEKGTRLIGLEYMKTDWKQIYWRVSRLGLNTDSRYIGKYLV